MTPSFSSSVVRLYGRFFLGCLLLVWLASPVFATNPSPVFGETLVINGQSFSCVVDDGNGGTDYSTSEDGTYHVGTYQGTGGASGTITVRGRISTPTLATVVGSNGASHDGFLQNGVYGDRVQSSSGGTVSLSFNGHSYDSVSSTTTYSVDLDNGTLASSTTSSYSGGGGSFTVAADGAISGNESGFYADNNWYVNGFSTADTGLTSPLGRSYSSVYSSTSYSREQDGSITGSTTQIYSGGSGAFTVAPDGTVSGAEHGFYLGGQWYLDSSVVESADFTTPNGNHYTQHRTAGTTYERDGGGVVATTVPESYSVPGGISFTVGADGALSGSESGFYVNGNWYINGSTYTPGGGGSMTLFGTVFQQVSSYSNVTYTSSSGANNSDSGSSYQSADGGSVSVWSWTNSGSAMSGGGMSGWDPYVGSFSTDSTGNLTFDPRGGPTFLPSQLWLNGTVLNWQGGSVDSSGGVMDTYSGSDAQGTAQSVVISGNARQYATAGATVDVSLNGSGVGTLTQAGGLSVGTLDLQAADPNRTSPLFFTGSMLWVNGSEYPFTGGYEDSAGHRTDTYIAPGGGTLTLIGSVASPATAAVQVVWDNTPQSGTASFGGGSASFEAGELDISTLPPSSGPPALWAAGRFYLRQPNTNRYVSGAYYLSLNGPDAAHFTLSGSSGGGALTGAFDATHGGVFAVMQNGSIPVAACPANEDGTLRLGAEAVPEHLPPAVMVSGAGIWRFIGTLNENNAVTACYANASAANSTEATDGAGCVLKIGTTDGSVMLCNYSAGTTSSGGYSVSTHLFQTGVQNSLPMPLVGVDPNANNLPWGLSAPAEGPASFQVGQDLWRYVGAGANGASLYQGYYNGQQLSLGAAGAGGGRLVTVTDPVHGNTTGLLNDVRAGTRLNNGTMVYAGGMDGSRAPSSVNNNGLLALSGNLDIPGNLLTLGSLNGDAAASGLTLQFSDSTTSNGGSIALLRQELGRDAAQWSWWRQGAGSGASSLPVMALDSGWGLTLYDPANPSAASIKLNPGGASSFKGPLRVAPAGDIEMGEFTNGPMP